MSKIAFVFPGQGSQTVGMGRSLRASGGVVASLFEEADDILGFALSRLMLEGPKEALTATAHAQPALVTTAMAALLLVRTATGLQPDFVAGHSLGEYAAIGGSGALTFGDALRLVRLRGEAMQAAAAASQGAMAAMLSMSQDEVAAVCQEASQATGLVCVPANFNAPGQIVISGAKSAVSRAIELARERGAKRCLMLEVSGAFHSPLMQPAAERMAQALADTAWSALAVPLVANVTATVVNRHQDLPALLVQQITSPVRWEESIRTLAAQGVDAFVELGTGKVLTGLLKRIDPTLQGLAVNGPEDLAALELFLANRRPAAT